MATRATSTSFLLISPLTSQISSDRPNPYLSFSMPWGSFHGNKQLVRRSYLGKVILKCQQRSTTATVFCSLPTRKYASEKIPKWSARAIRSFGLGELEARKLKYPNTGTEALLLGILIEGTSPAAKFLRANGITFYKVREEILNLLGRSDLYYFSPEHPPLTEQAERALDWAIEEKLKSGDSGEITTTHILLGIWSEIQSAGHKILAKLGFDDEKAKELAKSMNEDFALSVR